MIIPTFVSRPDQRFVITLTFISRKVRKGRKVRKVYSPRHITLQFTAPVTEAVRCLMFTAQQLCRSTQKRLHWDNKKNGA